MRLIDEEKLMEDIQKTITEQSSTIDWMNMIYRQPTAYDVDKVVEKLKEIRAKKTCNKEKCDTKELCRICVVDDAIEIVKQVGVSDDVCECRLLKGYNFLYKTSCSDVFDMENGFKYCPYCGKKIKVVE